MNSYAIPSTPDTGSAQENSVRIIPLLGRSIAENALPDWRRLYPDGVRRPCVLLSSKDGASCVVLDETALSSGTLVIGGVGCGKTTVVTETARQIIESMNREDVVIIFDTKGDFAEAFYDPHNPRHVIIGSPEVYPRTAYWNLFAEIGPLETLGSQATCKTDMYRARSIANRMFIGRESESQPFFTLTAIDLFAKGVMHLIRKSRLTGNRALLCNSALRDFFRNTDADGWKRVLTQDNPDFKASAVYFGGSKGDMGASILATLNSMVEDLLGGFFGDGGPQDTFSFREAVRSGDSRVIFIEYDTEIAEVLCPVYRLMVDQAIKLQTSQTTRKKGNLFLFVDELKLLPKLKIDDAVNFGRGRGMKVIAACQNINQIIDVYGREVALSMLNGFSTCIAFNNPDSETRRYLSERFGKIYQAIVYEPLRAPVAVTREGHALEDAHILALKQGEAAIQLAWHEHPFLFQFARYL